MTTTPVEQVAARLDDAVRSATAIPQPSAGEDSLTLPLAYEVQRAGLALRSGRGDTTIGVKLGFTSKAKAAQMGVSDVIIGAITSSMEVVDGGEIDLSALIHPRIEPEVAFLLGEDVDPHDPRSVARTAVSHVAPALEIIDSRYRDFAFSLEDVVADNTSAAGFVTGPWTSFAEGRVDLDNRGVILEQDGEPVMTDSTSAILGHPEHALSAAKRMARLYGHGLPAGTILLAGAATPAVPLVPGSRVEATVSGLGRVGVTATGASHG